MHLGLGLTPYIPIVIYFMGIVLLLLTLFYKAEIGLYFLILIIPLQNVQERLHQFPFGKDVIDIFLVAMLIGYLVQKNNKVEYSKRDMHNINVTILLLILFTYFSLWIGSFKLDLPLPVSLDNPQLAQWKNFIILPLLYYAALYLVKDRQQITFIIYIMIITMFYMDNNFYGEVGAFSIKHFRDDKRFNGAFTYLGPNELGAFYSYYTMFLLGFLLYEKYKLKKIIFSGIIVFNTYCILFLFSRGAYMASLIGLLFLGVVRSRKLLFIPLVLLIAWNTVLPTSVLERIEMTKTDRGIDPSILGRIQMWNQAMEIVSSNPLTGIGFGSTVYMGFKSFSGEKERSDIHNGYFEILMESGIIGLLLFLLIFYFAIKNGLALYHRAEDNLMKGLGLGFVTTVIACLVANIGGDRWSYLPVMGYFWILFGIVVKSNLLVSLEKDQMLTTL